MKTRDEVVDKALSDFKTKHASDNNWLKSRVMGAWNSGYTSGEKDGYAIGFEEGFKIADVNISKEDVYRSGYKDGYDEHDRVWKEKHELIDELKQQEYQRGLNDLWYAVRQLELSFEDGALSVEEIGKIFGTQMVYSIFKNGSPKDVVDKIRTYEEQKKKENGPHPQFEFDCCEQCAHDFRKSWESPCNECSHNHKDYFRMKEPEDGMA